MNTSVEGIIVNNCQYAPLYLIQDPSATQPNTYVLATPNCVEQPKPISNNLKTFYENSGNIENGLVNVDAVSRASVPKQKECILFGSNLKASFLLPKTEHVNKSYVVDNIVLKPNIKPAISQPPAPLPVNVNTVPKLDIDRKIVKLQGVPVKTRSDKYVPKIKPKENIPSPNPSKHTAVQLIKLGETYHSLNHLSENQMIMVNQALTMFKDPYKTSSEPTTYDPVTNTRYIYKLVSPKDLAVVGPKKFMVKEKKLTKIPKKVIEEKIKLMKQMKSVKEVLREPPESDSEPEPEPTIKTKVTRSGRKVKLPKLIVPEDSLHKSKKKSGTVISCFQCSVEFSSLYRLQKHYENHPTHIPAKIHTNLFHCLLAIVKSGSAGDKTNIFIQQLEHLIVKLKSLLPCLLKKVHGSDGQSCTINDDVGRLFGMNPGKYNIDVGALNCLKDKNGYCIHNPPKLNKSLKDHKPSILTKQKDGISDSESETENCARINSVAKWPTVSKRIWKLKNRTQELSAKKMRIKSEDTLIDMGTDDIVHQIKENKDTGSNGDSNTVMKLLENNQECKINNTPINVPLSNNIVIAEDGKPKSGYIQFHSAHFDIRSSPIKASSSTVFRKFQINQNQVQVIRSLEKIGKDHTKVPHTLQNPGNDLHIPLSRSNDNVHIPMSSSNGNLQFPMSGSSDSLHIPISNSTDNLHVASSNANNDLHIPLSSSSNGLNVSLPNLEDSQPIKLEDSDNSLHVTLPSSLNSLHANLPDSDNELRLPMPNSKNSLDVPLPSTENSLDISISLPNTENSLHDIFKDGVDLSCKDDSNIDPVLKEWIISTSEKSENSIQSFTKSNDLPAFLRGTDSEDKSMEKNVTHNGDMPSLDATDNRLLSNQGESVLNFLETLGNELVYPETEIRNSGIDFQLDLFTFHNS